MQCFAHDDRPAVGICKSCQKGLCRECAVDSGYGLSCHGKCEEEVKVLSELEQRSRSVYQKAGTAHKRNGLVYLMFGLITLTAGAVLLAFSDKVTLALFPILMGVVFLVGAFLSYRSGEQIASPEDS